MADKRRPIEHKMYDDRGHPRNGPPRARRVGADNSRVEEECPKLSRQDPGNTNANQFPENEFGPKYSNDVDISSWLRNGRADTKPGFDRGGAWRTDRDTGMRDQMKDFGADHNRHWTEHEASHNAGRTAAPEFHDYSKRHIPSYERRGELGLEKPDSAPKPRKG